jgi:hypothetical protein
MYYYLNEAPLLHEPLWWHTAGLTQTATGYGKKITTPYKVPIGKRKYRVYLTQHSNAGTLWITYKGTCFVLGTVEHVVTCQGIDPARLDRCIDGEAECA